MKNFTKKTDAKIPIALVLSLAVVLTFMSSSIQNDLGESIRRGKEVYIEVCATCHKSNGKGSRGKYPPLAHSNYLMADKERSIKIVINGLIGPIAVNDIVYDNEMLPSDLTEQETMDVLNYIRNSWGNQGEAVTLDEVMEAIGN